MGLLFLSIHIGEFFHFEGNIGLSTESSLSQGKTGMTVEAKSVLFPFVLACLGSWLEKKMH
jgi:hypothetical protein